MHLLQSKRSKSPCYAQYFALPQVKHVTLIFVPITSRVTGKCCRWCVRIQPVNFIRIPPDNRARRRCIRNEMRMKCDIPLIAIKIDHIHRQNRNRQIKRVTSNTPISCRKTNSWCWCAQEEDQPARCAKKKRVAAKFHVPHLYVSGSLYAPRETKNYRSKSKWACAINCSHPDRQEHDRQIKWIIQVAKPIYRSYLVSNLHFTFLHSCPSTRESYFMIILF